MDSFWSNPVVSCAVLFDTKQEKWGNGRLGLQCLAPGVWDMGHLAGFYQLEERGGCVTRCGALEACRSPVSCPVPPRSVVWGPGLVKILLRDLGFNGVSRQKSAALYHRGEGVAPISKIPPPPPSPSLSSPFFSPNPQRNLTPPAPLAVSSPTFY